MSDIYRNNSGPWDIFKGVGGDDIFFVFSRELSRVITRVLNWIKLTRILTTDGGENLRIYQHF